ncbi:hypothetical protein VCHC52A1_2514, partial [Vibrio cholerae HC-52A1]
MKHPHPSP